MTVKRTLEISNVICAQQPLMCIRLVQNCQFNPSADFTGFSSNAALALHLASRLVRYDSLQSRAALATTDSVTVLICHGSDRYEQLGERD